MGTTCVSYAERRKDERYVEVFRDVFPEQSYIFFAWLGLERVNFAKIPPLGTSIVDGEQLVYPAHLFIDFDYDQEFENRQVRGEQVAWNAAIKPNETGVMRTFRDAFGENWMQHVS